MLPKAVFFDLDDTIISFEKAGEQAWKDTCSSFVNCSNAPFCSDILLDQINKIRKWYWGDAERHRIGRLDMIKARRDIVKMALQDLEYYDEENASRLADNYSKLQSEMICLFPDSIATLEKLKKSGVRMALITNGSAETQRGKICRFNLSGYFEAFFIEGEVGFGKPDIRVYQLALKEFNLKPEDVWMVGDNLVWDIEAAQAVGIYAIWNDFRRQGLPANSIIIPDRIIHSIAELADS